LKPQENWVTPFKNLELLGGELTPILNNDEDMLEIRWRDGMWIDVGYIASTKTYYITTVSDDSAEAWNNPLSIIKVKDREELVSILQKEIIRCRS